MKAMKEENYYLKEYKLKQIEEEKEEFLKSI
jgi:hypothetical protein